MIKELILKDFGKFKNKEFLFGDITLFSGNNEAGKTTLFDALCYFLCRPKATKKTGKMIKERYGSSMEGEIHFSKEKWTLKTDEFLSLYAIRSGEVSLDFSSETAWTAKIKSRLFTGGIDPEKIKKHFENLSSSKGSLKHNKEYNELVSRKKELKERLNELKQKERDHCYLEKKIKQKENGLDDLEKEIKQKESLVRKLEQKLGLSNRLKEKNYYREILKKMRQAEKRSEQLAALSFLEQANIEDLAPYEHMMNTLSQGLMVCKEKSRTFKERKHHLNMKKTEIEVRYSRQKPIAEKTERYLKQLISFSANPPFKKEISWNRNLLIPGILIPIITTLAILLVNHLVFQIIIPVAGALAGILCFIFARKEKSIKDDYKIKLYLQSLKKQWEKDGAPSLKNETLEGLTEELYALKDSAASLIKEMDFLDEERVRLHQLLVGIARKEEEHSKTFSRIKEKISQWFNQYNVTGKEEFMEKHLLYQTLIQEENSWAFELEEHLKLHKIHDPNLLMNLAEKKIKEDSDAESFLPTEAEIKILENSSKKLNEELTLLKAELTRKTGDAARESGRFVESTGNLSREIVLTEKLYKETIHRLEELEIQKEGARMAGQIFEEIASASDSVMEHISHEIAALFGEIIPEFREVDLKSFQNNMIKVSDRGGEKRPLAHLSRGTREAFLLAGKLVLARKANPEKTGLLVFDESFHSLDYDRTERVLEMIQTFREQNPWQVVFLNKDPALSELVQKTFPTTKFHYL